MRHVPRGGGTSARASAEKLKHWFIDGSRRAFAASDIRLIQTTKNDLDRTVDDAAAEDAW
jgi:hypothetical protein